MECVFCSITEPIAENALAYALFDRYPVSPGHTLILPKRHVADYFGLTPEEEAALWALLRQVRERLQQELKPDGWNIGINNGAAAGQTVFHLHVHLIPRYEGDMAHPEGGVRGVIPERQKYSGEQSNR